MRAPVITPSKMRQEKKADRGRSRRAPGRTMRCQLRTAYSSTEKEGICDQEGSQAEPPAQQVQRVRLGAGK